jgi:hypothetical protein
MKWYVGISKYLGFDGMLCLLEIDYDTPAAAGKSYFERILGADYIRPEDLEIYDRKNYRGETFNGDLIKRLLPFQVTQLNLDALDFSEIRTVFTLKNSGTLRPDPSRFVEITDILDYHYNETR